LKDRKKTRLQISGARVDRSPLRALYIQQKDAVIYAIVLNFLIACDKVFWNKAPTGSYITKTVGVQALLDILRRLARPMLEERDISADAFEQRLTAASGIDFTAVEFRNASGAGRSDIRRAIEASLNLPSAVGIFRTFSDYIDRHRSQLFYRGRSLRSRARFLT
jgi:hypothetical protein